MSDDQLDLFDGQKAKKALDELFQEVGTYRKSSEYLELFQFIRRFPTVAPYNAFLLHVQKPGAVYVATVKRWREKFDRTITPGSRPLVILRAFGPVEFVYDEPDTEGGKPFPEALLQPFMTKGSLPVNVFPQLVGNLRRDLVRYDEADHGASAAGSIRRASRGLKLGDGEGSPAAAYSMVVNKNLDAGAKYATVVHELAHLYCGHLGSPDDTWWPDRQGLERAEDEFEAESVTWLVCERVGIENPSAEYLAGFVKKDNEVPKISLDAVLKAAGYIEAMGRRSLGLRRTLASGEKAGRGVRVE